MVLFFLQKDSDQTENLINREVQKHVLFICIEFYDENIFSIWSSLLLEKVYDILVFDNFLSSFDFSCLNLLVFVFKDYFLKLVYLFTFISNFNATLLFFVWS